MNNWRDQKPDVVAGMFDARLKSVLVQSHVRMFRTDDLYELNRGEGSDHHVSELDLSEPGIRLFLGRNGSGKTTLLQRLGMGITPFSGGLETSWVFSLPSEELLMRWEELVSEASRSNNFREREFDDPHLLERNMLLPVLEILRDQQLDFNEGDLGEKDYDLLEELGFTEMDNQFRGRFDPTGDRSFCGPPLSYSPRTSAWLWTVQALKQEKSIFADFGEEDWIVGDWSATSSTFYLRNKSVEGMCGDAIRQFFREAWGIEFAFSEAKPCFRFLASRPDSGPLREILRHRDEAIAHECFSLMFPLDFFETTSFGAVASVWYNCAPRGSVKLDDHQRTVDRIRSFLLPTFVDLRGDIHEQLSDAWSRIIDSHLKVVVVRAIDDLQPNLESEHGSSFGGCEHVIVDGFDRLDEFLNGLTDDLLELDIGVQGLRAARPHEGLWKTRPSKPGGFFGALDFGSWIRTRQVIQSPKMRWMSELVLEWKQPTTGEWLDLTSASQGQRDVILMLLAMATSSMNGEAMVKDRLLLIDEFDQHLHPTVSSKFLEIAHRRALQSRTRAILSTHSVPVLNDQSARQAPRIFARRTLEGAFSYSQLPPSTREQLAAELGVDLFAALSLTHLFVLVEGEHDEVVIRGLLDTGRGGPELTGVELINARGTWAFEGIWNNVLRYHSAPVLCVHDKRNVRFEEAWADLKQKAVKKGAVMPRWVDTDFAQMKKEINQRSANLKSKRGDDETDKLLSLVLSIFGGRECRPSARDVLRLTFHGIDSPDIIRLLPVENFPEASRHGSWEAAEAWWDGQNKGRSWDTKFKKNLMLRTEFVAMAMSKTLDRWHPELQRLFDVMVEVHKAGGPPD